MALKNLSTSSMISVSSRWIDPKQARPTLAKHPLLAGLLPLLDEAHASLLASQKPEVGPNAAEIAANREAARASDDLHDHKARGSWNLLTGLAELAEDATHARALLALRDRVIPNGLDTTAAKWSEEAGHVAVIEDRLDEPTRKALKKVHSTEGRTLLDEIERWITAGTELGQLEARHGALTHSTGKTPSLRADAVKARNTWIAVANALRSNLGLVATLSDDDQAEILGELTRAETRADRRTPRAEPDDPEEKVNGGSGGRSGVT